MHENHKTNPFLPAFPKTFAPKASGSAQVASEGSAPAHALGKVIHAHRTSCGLTQRYLANHLGVDIRTIQRWENGQRIPRGKRLEYLFIFLEIPLQEILVAKRRLLGLTEKPVDKFTDLRV